MQAHKPHRPVLKNVQASLLSPDKLQDRCNNRESLESSEADLLDWFTSATHQRFNPLFGYTSCLLVNQLPHACVVLYFASLRHATKTTASNGAHADGALATPRSASVRADGALPWRRRCNVAPGVLESQLGRLGKHEFGSEQHIRGLKVAKPQQ